MVGGHGNGDVPLLGGSIGSTGAIDGEHHGIGAGVGIGVLRVLCGAAAVIPEGPGPCGDLPCGGIGEGDAERRRSCCGRAGEACHWRERGVGGSCGTYLIGERALVARGIIGGDREVVYLIADQPRE
jgi:hypothetical protein